MATITIDENTVAHADKLLSTFLAEKVPDADFSPGSAIRDLVVKSIAYIFAYLEAERETLRSHSSLLLLSQRETSTDVDAAVDAYLSNLFLVRKTGKPTRLMVTCHFSMMTDVVVSANVRFFRTVDRLFVPDIVSTVVIPASDLRQNTNTDGTNDWVASFPLVSAGNNEAYNVGPGRFVQVDKFNPYFIYAENLTEGRDGRGMETTSELLARAPTALSTRNLVNERSIAAVLFDKFPALDRALAVGMGDTEMIRDLVRELAPRFKMHVGGCTDVYLGLPRTTYAETNLTVGGEFLRTDGRVALLKDAGADFSNVRPGHVLSITSGLPNVPFQTVVSNADTTFIEVTTPFVVATDEALIESEKYVTYSVGAFGPDYRDVLDLQTTGQTTRTEISPNEVYLVGQPVYRINDVRAYQTSTDAATFLTTRVNTTPTSVEQYTVTVSNPESGQSSQAVTTLEVHSSLNNVTLDVTYDTLVGYGDIQTYIAGRFDRIINADHLARGYNPVYVHANIGYSLKYGSTALYTQEELRTKIVSIVNNYDWTNILSVSAITDALRVAYPDIETIYPFTIYYTLCAPDGQIIEYSSNDIVTVIPQYGSSATLLNATLLRAPILTPEYGTLLKTRLNDLGVTDRTVRYFADLNDIYVWQRGVDVAPVNYTQIGPGLPPAPALPTPTPPTPTITTVTPESGSVRGATLIVVSGSNFVQGLTIKFGGVKAGIVEVINGLSHDEIHLYAPPYVTPESVNVVVTNPSGKTATKPAGYQYLSET